MQVPNGRIKLKSYQIDDNCIQVYFKCCTIYFSITLFNVQIICFQIDLVLKSDGGDLSDFTTNGEWYLLGEYLENQFNTLNLKK